MKSLTTQVLTSQTEPSRGFVHTSFVGKEYGTMASKYDQVTKHKAIRLVRDHAADYDSEWAAICEISGRLGMTAETLRRWIRQDQVVDAGQVAG